MPTVIELHDESPFICSNLDINPTRAFNHNGGAKWGTKSSLARSVVMEKGTVMEDMRQK